MQKFCDLPYKRPDVEGVGRQLETLVEKLKMPVPTQKPARY